MPKISEFKGEYGFLSNFSPAVLTVDGQRYPTLEHAFQACKTPSPFDKQRISTAPTPGAAKRLGRRVRLYSNWEEIKVKIMHMLLLQKFADPVLQEKLLATGDAELEEGNWWGDKFWGVCDGEGQNMLGRLLMQVRSYYQKKNA